MIRLLTFLAVLYTAWLLTLYLLQERLLFPGAYAMRQELDPPPDHATVLEIRDNGQFLTEGWLLPARDNQAAPLLVLLHGNADRIDRWVWRMRPYQDAGYAVLLVEYRGFGNSRATPGQDELVADTLALIDLANARPEVDANRLILHGASIGGAVAAQVAAQRTPEALILESAPADLTLMTRAYLAPAFLLRHPFRGADALRGQSIPTLILHGEHDRTVEVAHANLFAAAIPNARKIIYDCGHNDMPPDDQRYWNDLLSFLKQQAPLPVASE